MEVLCVGQLVTDIIAAHVDYARLVDDTRRVDRIELKSGGDCMNVAIGLAKLGRNVGFVGKIGDDGFGSFLRSELEKNHVDMRGLKMTSESPTSSVIALVNEQGQRVFLYYGGTNDLFSLSDIDLSLLDDCVHVHVSGTYLLPAFDGEGCARLLSRARERGRTTSMDVTWDVTGRWLSVIDPCLPHLDLFMPSETEAARITGCESPEGMAEFLLERGVDTVVIKLGEKGAYIRNRKESFYQRAFAATVVDTTGAGDAFVAGFLSHYTDKRPLRECAEFAAAVAAHCIREVGATSGIPGEDVVLSFIHSCTK